MNLLDLYYIARPAIPQTWRFAIRGCLGAWKRKRYENVWPINEAAVEPPEWWSGWPKGKRFAFVLTHDVEGQKGMDQCRMLAELEMELGFRSSFNFVPEGSYNLSDSLRTYLIENGFEVGVHDLRHDGTLYRSKASFMAGANRINEHLESWGAVGFRSAFMFHNIEWIKQINCLYDASTFDTDPFEPQPDGVSTIFPFWVARSDGSGYVELPYTLAQDSTLFLVLRETTNDIWKRKLDWLAQNGGLALINVHPDYFAFGERVSRTEFPVTLYKEFLTHVSAQFGDAAWCVLPREVAQFVKNSLFSKAGTADSVDTHVEIGL